MPPVQPLCECKGCLSDRHPSISYILCTNTLLHKKGGRVCQCGGIHVIPSSCCTNKLKPTLATPKLAAQPPKVATSLDLPLTTCISLSASKTPIQTKAMHQPVQQRESSSQKGESNKRKLPSDNIKPKKKFKCIDYAFLFQ